MKLKLTDANGKRFETSLSQIQDMSCEVIPVIVDGKTKSNFKISVKDSEGKERDIGKIADDAKTDPKAIPKAIDVTFEATHSGQNRNYAIYHSSSMEQDAGSWMTPFPRPLLKNHDVESEPMGRVSDFLFKRSDLNPERDCISVTWRVTDQEAIPKFLDGRYSTMSIGASGNHISCSICGKDILKDGNVTFCGHWKGEVYNNQKCYWNVTNMEYKEGSVVNTPADDWAQTTGVKAVSDSQESGKGGTQMDQLKDNSQGGSDLLSQIDALTTAKLNPDPTTDGEKNTEGGEGEGKGGEGEEDEGGDEEDEGKDSELIKVTAERDSLKVEVATLRTDNQTLTTDLNKAKDRITELEGLVGEAKKSDDALKEEVRVVDEEAKANRKQSIQLAMMNKDLLANRLADFKIFSNEAKVEDRETLITEFKAKPAKELTDAINVYAAKKSMVRPTVSVDPIGLMNPKDQHSTTDTESSKDTKATKEPSMKELEDAMIDAFTSNKSRNNYEEE